MKIYAFVILTIILCFLNCSSKSQDDSIQFHVDKNLLGQSYSIDSLNFSFAPPLGWNINPLKPEFQQPQKFQSDELKSYSLYIKTIFRDSSSSSFCSISQINSTDSVNINQFLIAFNSLMSQQFKPENIKEGRFKRNNIEIVQFLMMTDSKVFFKLFFQPVNKYILQLDYAIDRKIYPNYIKKIESSIGSISAN